MAACLNRETFPTQPKDPSISQAGSPKGPLSLLRWGGAHLVTPLEHVLVPLPDGPVDVQELLDAVFAHVLRVPLRLLPAERRALRQKPHGSAGEEEARGAREERERRSAEKANCGRCRDNSEEQRGPGAADQKKKKNYFRRRETRKENPLAARRRGGEAAEQREGGKGAPAAFPELPLCQRPVSNKG